jgi:hypothetical protein
VDPKTNHHIPLKSGRCLTGTARYASLKAHLGFEQSRRDDLEGLGNTFVYMLKGALPWQGLNATTKENRLQKITDAKKNTPVEKLCSGLPHQLLDYFTYIRKLEFEEAPCYTYLHQLFQDLFIQIGGLNMDKLNWNSANDPKEEEPTIKLNGKDVEPLNIVAKPNKNEEMSKLINANSKSRNDLSVEDENIEIIKNGDSKQQALIHVPYTGEGLKCKVVLDRKKFASSRALSNLIEDVAEEKDSNVVTHLPMPTDYMHDNSTGFIHYGLKKVKSLCK